MTRPPPATLLHLLRRSTRPLQALPRLTRHQHSSATPPPPPSPAAARAPQTPTFHSKTPTYSIPALTAAIPPTWRLTLAGTALERHYTFPTARATHDFCAGVAELATTMRHHPEWAGHGRRVFVRWTTHRPRGLGRNDVEAAKACEALAVKKLGVKKLANGDGDEGLGRAWLAKRGEGDNGNVVKRMWPEWVKGTGFGWAWGKVVRKAIWKGNESGFAPVWCNVYNLVGVSQGRFRVVEDGGEVVGVEMKPSGRGEEDEVRELVWKKHGEKMVEALGMGEREKVEHMEVLMEKVTWDWKWHGEKEEERKRVQKTESRKRKEDDAEGSA